MERARRSRFLYLTLVFPVAAPTLNGCWSGLVKFLVDEKGFSLDRVKGGIKRMKEAKSKGKGNQQRLSSFFTVTPSAKKPSKKVDKKGKKNKGSTKKGSAAKKQKKR